MDLSETIPPPRQGDGEHEEFFIEKIMGHVDDGPRARKFLLKAVGFNNPSDYWFENEKDLDNVQELVEEYMKGTPRELVSTRKMARQLSSKRTSRQKRVRQKRKRSDKTALDREAEPC